MGEVTPSCRVPSICTRLDSGPVQERLEALEQLISPNLHDVIVPGTLDRKEELGFTSRGEEPLPHGERDDCIARPMDD